MILGIDEAGRGPWAGPLVVGAVVLGGAEITGLTDSKKLSKKKRETLYDDIVQKAAGYATGWISARELDEHGMSQALSVATRRAVEQITSSYSEIIIDGLVNFLAATNKGKYVQTMPKADLLIPSVSAASIIAKVERDRYMEKLDAAYPEYGFKNHSGYGVARHRAAIEKYGVTPEHRLSFAPLSLYKREGSTSPSADGLLQTAKSIGAIAETIAAGYLEAHGHVIIDQNWRTKFCEIDIVSQKGDTVYFVEVKHRTSDKAGDGLAMITPRKLKQMQFAANLYAHRYSEKRANLQLAAVATSGAPPSVTEYIEII
jgi:ribonuclease HII